MTSYKKKYERKGTNVNAIFYNNAEGIKITVFSPYELIIKEIISLGINPTDKTIKELQIEVSKIILEEYMDSNFGKRALQGSSDPNKLDRYNQKRVIIHHLKELSYWLYDYNVNKMPKGMKFDFELNQKASNR